MRLQRQSSGLQQRNDGFYEVSKVRQGKGNQELNEELELKAIELEKLFAQFISPRRITPADVQMEDITVVQLPEKEAEKQVELNPNMNIVELGLLNSSKGRLYERYMQVRDAKLRDEWDSRRIQNQEKMQVMNQKLERIQAVMQASSAGSFNQQESANRSSYRPEKFRCFDMRSVEKNIDQKLREPVRMQEDYVSDSSENGSTRNNRSKKLSHSRTFSSSSAPRSTPPPIPRSASRSSNIGKRRIAPESPVNESVPNFSQLKEHNSKQSQVIRKETPRQQYSHVPRSKSTNGHTPPTKKDDVSRSQSMKKSSANTFIEPKQFLKKGNGIGPGAGAGIAKLKATMEPENTGSEEESSQMVDKREDPVSVIKETTVRTITTNSAIDRSAVPITDDIVILKMRSQVEPDLASEFTPPLTAFHTPVKPVQDSPVQSPASWSSRTQSPFSYTHNRSDLSVESPRDSPSPSPASFNSKLLANMETDSPRSRKKWGATQNPLITPEHQTNNVAKGIKRLLNFGRKTRGTEGLADSISTTTSEGDDETDEGRYPANHSSDDLRKSRMGHSQGHYSYEASNASSVFINKEVRNLRSSIPRSPDNYKLKDHNLAGSLLTAPKSFFSLSTFRSKGSEVKTR